MTRAPARAVAAARPRRLASLALLALLALLAPLGACTEPARGEAASVLAAVDRFRHAEYAAKPALLGPLKETPCTDPEVCAAKEACVAHAEPLVQAITMKAEVQRRMDEDAGRLDDVARAALVAKLDEASRLLDTGRAAQAACDQRTIALRMKHRF